MAEFLETVLFFELILSTTIILLLIILSYKFKEKLISRKTMEMVNKKKIILYIAFFFGIVAMSLFIGIELLEAGDVVFMFVEKSILKQLESIMIFSYLSAQVLILSLVLEARHIES